MAIRKKIYLFNMYLYVLNDNTRIKRIIKVYKVNTFYYHFIFHPLQEKVKSNVNKMRGNNLEEDYQANFNQEYTFKSPYLFLCLGNDCIGMGWNSIIVQYYLMPEVLQNDKRSLWGKPMEKYQ